MQRAPRPLQGPGQPLVVLEDGARGPGGEDEQRVLRVLGWVGLSAGALHRGPENPAATAQPR